MRGLISILRYAGLILLPGWCALVPVAAQHDDRAPYAELVKDLDSPDFRVRETATRRLLKTEGAANYLRKLLEFPSLTDEPRRRVERVLRQIDEFGYDRTLEAFARCLKSGHIDEIIDVTAEIGVYPSPEAWERILARATETQARVLDKKQMPVPVLRPHHTKQWSKIVHVPAAPSLLVNKNAKLHNSLLIATLPVEAAHLSDDVVFTNADLKCRFIYHSIVFCDGDVTASDFITYSLVIATGTIKTRSQTKSARLFPRFSPSKDVITLFDTKQVGIEIATDNKKLVVVRVEPGGPFDRAGIAHGDGIIEMDGKPIANANDFRRTCRRSYACSRNAALVVDRAGQRIAANIVFSVSKP